MAEKLGVGAIGAKVARLHEELQRHRFEIPDSEVRREFFGPGTREAVLACQREHGLACSGEVDQATTALLSENTPSGAGGIAIPGAKAGGVTRTPKLGLEAASGESGMRSGASGPVVANLHRMLAAQGFTVTGPELERQLFGPATELALRQWQRANDQEPTGILTEAVAPALGVDLELPGKCGEPQPSDSDALPPEFEFLVRGQVIYKAGLPIEGVTVRAVHKELRRELLLGEATSDATGRFEIYYGNARIPRPEQGVDLLVRAYRRGDDGQAAVIGDWPVIFGARRVEKVRIKVDGGPGHTWSEYEQVMSEVEPLLDGANLADMVETGDQRDISLLAGKTSQIPKRIADLVVAHKLAAATGSAPELYYGLIRTDMPTTVNQLLNQPAGVQKLALQQAIDRHVIPGRLTGHLDQAQEELRAQAVRLAAAAEAPNGAATIGGLLTTVLPDEAERRTFLDRYATHRGPIENFWQGVADDPRFKERVPAVQFTLQAAALTGGHLPLVRVLQQRRDAGEFATLRQLAGKSVDYWKATIAAEDVAEDHRVPPAIPGDADERVRLYAETIHRVIADLVPTDAVAYHIQADERQPEASRVFWRNVTASETEVDFRSARVDELLAARPELLDGIAEEQHPALRADLATTRRLFNVTTRYEGLDALKRGGVDSAQAAVRLGQGVFVKRYADALGGDAAALVAFEKATAVAGGSLNFCATYAPEFNTVLPRVMLHPTPNPISNLRTLFGSTDLCACSHCRSVHGPAAYLADLFAYLQDRSQEIEIGGGATIETTVLATLLQRRPDLGEIELTCANTQTPLPYVDLVNEVLETIIAPFAPFDLPAAVAADLDARTLSQPIRDAFGAKGITLSLDHYIVPVTPGQRWFITDHSRLYPIAKQGGGDLRVAMVAYQTGGTPQELAANPEHINAAAYQTLRGAVFPANLPLDLWWEEARVYLGQLGVERDALMTTLWTGSPIEAATDLAIITERLGFTTVERELITGGLRIRLATDAALGVLNGTPNVDGVATAEGDLILVKDQAAAAENGLYRVAAAAWTRLGPASETHLVAVAQGNSGAATTWLIGPGADGAPGARRLQPWAFWGLAETNNQIEIFDPAQPDGPTVADVDWLAAPAWVPQIRSRAGVSYSELIDLLSTRFVNPTDNPANRLRIVSADPNDETTCQLWKLRITNLDTEAASRLRRFTRLWRRLGWSARELDEAITALGGGIVDVNARLTDGLFAILSQVERLRALLNLPVEQILTFWTPLPTYNPIPIDQVPPQPRGGEALYHRLFRNPAVITPLDDAFRLDGGELSIVAANPQTATIAAHLPGVLAGIGLTAAELEALLPLAAPTGALTLANLSALYRHVRLARGLDLPVADLVTLREMSGLDPFDPTHPETAMQFVTLAGKVRSSGFSALEIDELLFQRVTGPGGLIPTDAALAQTLDELRSGLRALQEQTALQPDPTGDLTRATLATLRWPADVVDKVIRALDGTNTADPAVVLGRWARAYSWPVLREPLAALPGGVVFPADLRRRVFYDAPTGELAFIGMMGEVDKNRLDALSNEANYRATVQALFARTSNDEPPAGEALLDPADRAGDVASILALPTVEERFAELLGRLLTYLRRVGSTRLLTQRLAETLGVPVRTAERLLNGQVKAITDPGKAAISDFLVSAYAESDPNVAITRDGFPAQMQTLMRLHKVALLASRLRWQVAQLDWLTDFGPDVPARPAAWRSEPQLLVRWLDLNDLPAEETARDPARFAAWLRLVDLTALRTGIPHATQTLTDLFALARTPGVTPDELLDLLAEHTGWERDDLAAAAGGDGLALVLPDAFRDEWALARLRDLLRTLRRLGASAAQARAWSGAQPTETDARAIRQAVRVRYPGDRWYEVAAPLRDKLRERQRQSLVAYLVSGAHPDHGLRWKDANALYADYLIDVEMDPCMTTSRIKQALSSVQLFTQRCLLNLEAGIVADANVDPGWEEWRWRKNYRVWEANLRIFLYPENWLEPELRDGKSPIFQALENTLQQGEVTKESAEDAFRDYLHALDAIARLEILGLYDQPAADGQPRVLHVIGRTAGTPGVFFYRQQIDNASWTPWERIDLDITEPQVLPIVWNRRFYLFWPIITETATQTIPTGNKPQQPERYFDLQIAWSERKGNGWSPKKVTKQTVRANKPRPNEGLADHGRGEFVLRAAFEGAGLKVWYEYDTEGAGGGVTESAPPPVGTNQPVPTSFATTGGFHFTGCDGQVELFSIAIGGIYQVQGTEVDGMLFRESRFFQGMGAELSMPLRLPKGASENGDDTALALTPGIFSIAYPHQDGYLNGRRPFFFQDQEKTYFVVPSEETVIERNWSQPVKTTPGIIDIVNKYYFRPVWVDPLGVDPLGPIKHPEGVLVPRGPVERTVVFDPQTPLERIADPVPVERFLLSSAREAVPAVAVANEVATVNVDASPVAGPANQPHATRANLLTLTGGRPVRDAGLALLNARATTSTTQATVALGQKRAAMIVRPDLKEKVVVAKGDRAVIDLSQYVDHDRIFHWFEGGTWTSVTKSVNRYRFYPFQHPYSCAFQKELNRAGVEGLLRRDTQLWNVRTFKSRYNPTGMVVRGDPKTEPLYPVEDVDFSYDGAYALYNWELFFHAPLLIANRLSQNQRFEEARDWFHAIFDPTDTTDPAVTVDGTVFAPRRFWRTRPFWEESQADYLKQRIDRLLAQLAEGSTDPDLQRQVSEWTRNPFNPHAIARLRIAAYQKRW